MLTFMAESDRDWGVRELARELALSPSTCLRALTALCESGLVEQDEATKRFDLSGASLRLAHHITRRHNIADLVRPVLERITERSGEAAVLSIVDWRTSAMMFVAGTEADHPLRYVVPLYEWGPMSTGASGLAALAYGPTEQVDDVLAALTRPRRREVEEQLEHVREHGYVCTHGQRIAGAVGIAGPVLGPDGHARGTITITVPEFRYDEDRLPALVRVLGSGVDEASRLAGARV